VGAGQGDARNERVSLSGEGALWGRGPTAHDLVELVRRAGGARNPVVRDRLVSLFIEAELLRVLRLRMVSAIVAGKSPGAEASVRKAIADDHGKHVMELGRDLAGPAGTLAGTGPLSGWPEAPDAAADPQWSWGYLFSPALTIGGGRRRSSATSSPSGSSSRPRAQHLRSFVRSACPASGVPAQSRIRLKG